MAHSKFFRSLEFFLIYQILFLCCFLIWPIVLNKTTFCIYRDFWNIQEFAKWIAPWALDFEYCRILYMHFPYLCSKSFLVTYVGYEMCWWQLKDVGDGFGQFGHQHPLSLYISFGNQHSKDVTNIYKSSATISHQHPLVTNITVATYTTDTTLILNLCWTSPFTLLRFDETNREEKPRHRDHSHNFLSVMFQKNGTYRSFSI